MNLGNFTEKKLKTNLKNLTNRNTNLFAYTKDGDIL